MIFASVGSQLPFDRMVRAIDEWARDNPQTRVYIQIGDGAYEPQHAGFARTITVKEYRERVRSSSLFVAHVGMGSILQGLEARKQMLLLPRLASQREHTTDHQLHTAARFKDTPGLKIVDDVATLKTDMTRLLKAPMKASTGIPRFAAGVFTDKVAAYLAGRATPRTDG